MFEKNERSPDERASVYCSVLSVSRAPKQEGKLGGTSPEAAKVEYTILYNSIYDFGNKAN